MHLCYLLPPVEFYSPQVGGAIATFAMQQGRRLQALGHRVSVVAPHFKEAVYDVGEFFPLRGVTRAALHPLQRVFSSQVRRRLSRADYLYFEYYRGAATRVLPQVNPDAILTFNDWHTPLFVKQTLPRARVFLRLSNERPSQISLVKPAVEAVERIFALSSYMRDWTASQFDIAPEKFTLLPNGADLDSFFPAPDTFSRVLSPAPVRALFLSRLHPNKGPDTAFAAVEMARDAGCSLEFSIAGDRWFYPDPKDPPNPFLDALRATAQRLQVPMLGHVERPEVPLLVRNHDVLLLPVRYAEPMSQVVFEAMASGLAIVSCALGGLPEACGEAALWAQPDDASSVAAHLRHLCQDRDFLVERKKLALQRSQIMTWDKNAAIFNAVLQGRNGESVLSG